MKKIWMRALTILGLNLGIAFAGDVKNIGSAKEFDDLVNAGKPVLVDFFATWCGPCKQLEPTIDELAREYGDKVTFVKVDVDQVEDLAARFQIEALPTIQIFNGGKEQEPMVGIKGKDVYKEALDTALAASENTSNT